MTCEREGIVTRQLALDSNVALASLSTRQACYDDSHWVMVRTQ